MISHVTPRFRQCYLALPREVRRDAWQAYRLWRSNPFASGLRFKEVSAKHSAWSVRVGRHYRALGSRSHDDEADEDVVKWFWIGTHAEYDKLVDALR